MKILNCSSFFLAISQDIHDLIKKITSKPTSARSLIYTAMPSTSHKEDIFQAGHIISKMSHKLSYFIKVEVPFFSSYIVAWSLYIRPPPLTWNICARNQHGKTRVKKWDDIRIEKYKGYLTLVFKTKLATLNPTKENVSKHHYILGPATRPIITVIVTSMPCRTCDKSDICPWDVFLSSNLY